MGIRSDGYYSTAIRAHEMHIGQQYEMQRSPSRRIRRVTLLDKDAPSGRSHWVLVRFEDGLSAGEEKEVSSQSLFPLSGSEERERELPIVQKPKREVPADWAPVQGDAVAWTQTLGSRCTVLAIDSKRRVAQIEAIVLGMREQFDAPISELSPFHQPDLVLHDGELEERLGDRLPEPRASRRSAKPKPRRIQLPERKESVVERLMFSPSCIAFYRKSFAPSCNTHEAEERLRAELREAKQLRKHSRREYLRLRVPRRFDVVLQRRPVPGDVASCYISRLQLPAKAKRQRRAA